MYMHVRTYVRTRTWCPSPSLPLALCLQCRDFSVSESYNNIVSGLYNYI